MIDDLQRGRDPQVKNHCFRITEDINGRGEKKGG